MDIYTAKEWKGEAMSCVTCAVSELVCGHKLLTCSKCKSELYLLSFAELRECDKTAILQVSCTVYA